jgi:hypothetical protein
MALAYRLDAISKGPENSRILGPNSLPLALIMDMHTSKTLCTGLYKSKMRRWFYAQEPTRVVSGPILRGGRGAGA